MSDAPVIAIDGPSASGKGTVAERVARALGFHFLDSGALYRLAALKARKSGVEIDDEIGVAALAERLAIEFRDARIWLDGEDVTLELRAEQTGRDASHVAALPRVRAALLARQRAFRRRPGLVADGRDMGSVIFPTAEVKIFLTASVEKRAERRYKQLIDKGLHANLRLILEDLKARDERDSQRQEAPLRICDDAVVLDTSELTIDEAVGFVIETAHAKGVS